MLVVKILNSTVTVVERKEAPLLWKTIKGADGLDYKVEAEGSRKTTVSVLASFDEPVDGKTLPAGIAEKFSEEQMEVVLNKISRIQRKNAQKIIGRCNAGLGDLLSRVDQVDASDKSVSDFFAKIEQIRTLAKKAKWDQNHLS